MPENNFVFFKLVHEDQVSPAEGALLSSRAKGEELEHL